MKLFDVGGIKMSLPIILGAGAAKHSSQAIPYLQLNAPLGASISGSYTLEPREGNNGDLAWPADLGEILQKGCALNAYGMPNIGVHKAVELFPADPEKPHIVSIAGFNAGDYVEMLRILKGNGHISGVEINAGCPNTGHLPVAYVLEDLSKLLDKIAKVDLDLPIWLKLSPYMTECELQDFAHQNSGLNFESTPTVPDSFIHELCDLLMYHTCTVSAVVISNTIPNVSRGDSITVKNADGTVHHKGGLSGPVLLPHNLKLIEKMVVTGITAHIDIIGCGGILSGDDALSYLDAGCVGVQCTSGPAWSGVKFFQQVLEGSDGLQEYLCQKEGE
jgi:dihydroorotate dehydrogenase (NAD+) catalytic subunit